VGYGWWIKKRFLDLSDNLAGWLLNPYDVTVDVICLIRYVSLLKQLINLAGNQI
jgi:hypothetical protein